MAAPGVGEKGKKRGQIRKIWASKASPEVATLSPPQITSRFASLAYFSPNGESGPRFKYGFINIDSPFHGFFSSFDKRAGREYPSKLVKKAP